MTLRAPRVALLVVVGAAVLTAREQAPQPHRFRIEANYVRVDVYPTAAGQPIFDLTRDDFEVFEDGVPQKIDNFELVRIRPAGSQESRVEPNSVREADAMAADPRSRIFVLFLDTYHVSVLSAMRMRKPLVQMLDRLISPDDLVAVMTPEMSARDVTFARRTQTIEGALETGGFWGRRQRDTLLDPEEEMYQACYSRPAWEPVWREMIARRREKLSLDAVQDLIRHLRGVREERKAVITITDGWRLYQPDQNLARQLRDGQLEAPVPGRPEVGIGPDGRLRSGSTDPAGSMYKCDSDRMMLAQLDHERLFRDILQEANRANASFYPVDPRGLPVFDTDIGPDKPASPSEDAALLRNRQNSLRELAGNTDGIAIVSSNDIDAGLRRITSDLSSYYLLGYYSSNQKFDGKYRKITVRVKRPGVEVRHRRGYRAATEDEVDTAARATAEAANPTLAAIRRAFEQMAVAGPHARLHVEAVLAPDNSALVIGELDFAAIRAGGWEKGGKAVIVARNGTRVNVTAETTFEAGERTFIVTLPSDKLSEPGEYVIQARAYGTGTGALPLSDTARLTIVPDVKKIAGDPVFLRRGPTTRTRYEPTADIRFRRNERLRIELPVSVDASRVEIRLLDRESKPMAVPTSVVDSELAKTQGGKWVAGELPLNSLAQADYAIEVTIEHAGGKDVVVTAFRIVP